MATKEQNTIRPDYQGAGTSNTIILPAIEQAAVKNLIIAFEQELTALTLKISSANGAAISAIRRNLQTLRVAIAPHKRVPYEIWTKIFMQTLRFHNKDQNLYLHISDAVAQNPFYLRHICASWRKIATSHRALSNRIILAAPLDTSRSREGQCRSWKSMVTLAEKIIPSEGPLHFAISHDYDFYMKDAIHRLVTKNADRVKGLGLRSYPRGIDHVMRHLGSFPTLETLTLDYIRGSEAKVWMVEYPQVEYSDNIRKISLSNINGSPMFNLTYAKYFKWDQLTHLELDPDSSECLHSVQVFRALSRCRNLITCYITFWDDTTVPYWDEEESRIDYYRGTHQNKTRGDFSFHITLPHLRSLRVRTMTPDPFSSLTVPSLKELEIKRFCLMPAEDIRSMIERSSCRLTKYKDTLGYNYRDNNEELFNTSLLSRLECVTEFSSRIPLDRRQLEKISSGALLPNVTILKAKCSTNMSPKDMIEFLGPRSVRNRSQTPSSATLRSIQLFVDYAVFEAIGFEDFGRWLDPFSPSQESLKGPQCYWRIKPVNEPLDELRTHSGLANFNWPI